jgi:hypothetical protein
MLVSSHFVKQSMGMMLAELNKKDLTILSDMTQTGKGDSGHRSALPIGSSSGGSPVSRQGHARGKVIITLE